MQIYINLDLDYYAHFLFVISKIMKRLIYYISIRKMTIYNSS